MSARKFMYDGVTAIAPVAFGDRVFESGAVEGPEGEGDSPDNPFIVIRASTNQPPLFMSREVKVKQSRFQVWVHDTPGDTSTIDAMVKTLEDDLPDAAPYVEDGNHYMECRWEDSSADAYDDHFQTTTRYVTFLVTWRPASS